MKRFYLVFLLPGLCAALFVAETLRRHGCPAAGLPVWLVVGASIVVLLAWGWLGYARFLQRFARIPYERALRLDLLSHLPLAGLAVCFLPPVAEIANSGLYALGAALALVLLMKAATLLSVRPTLLEALRARPALVLGAIVGLGLVLRLSLIAANRFYGDEALYAHWGLLIATGRDVFLKTEIVDKPPLFFYTLALFFKLLGPSETVARLPNLIASISGIAIVYAMARQLYGRRVATLAALFLALSPFDILFAPTAFTDPLMVALALGSCLAALNGQHLAAGLLAGLAALTKPTAVFFLPLLGFLAVIKFAREGRKPQLGQACVRAASGLAAVVALGAVWDRALRPTSPSVLDAGSVHYGGLKLVPLAQVPPRLGEWLGQLQYLTASPLLDAFFLVGVLALLLSGLWQRARRPGWAYDLGLAGFALLFMAAHTLLSFSAWDRYLLGLAPILAILLARIALLPFDLMARGEAGAWRAPACASLMAAFLAVAMLPPVRAALSGSLPVGSDHGKFTGIDQVAAYFRGNVAPGAAVFHHHEGWHYSYYMFDYPYSFYYYPDAAYVLDMVRRLPPDQGKYLALPNWVDASDLQAILNAGGWQLRDVYHTYRPDGTLSFTVYRIEPQGK